MRRFRTIAFAAAILIAAAPAQPDTPLEAKLSGAMQVLGTVTNAARPVGNVLVIALNLQDFAATQTYTALDGSFSLPTLRSGIYKIIAVKQGFTPAITTLVPSTQTRQKVALKLESEKKQARRNGAAQEIWELSGSLPADVLRELDFAMADPSETLVTYELPRFRGEMQSVTGVAQSQPATNPAFAHTTLGVQGRLGGNWQLGISGALSRIEDPSDGESFGSPLAESTGMQMELRSSPNDSYRIASTKSQWLYNDADANDRRADVRAHNFEWQHGLARVQVRYFAQENLFQSSPFESSNLIEITGDTTVLQTRRSDLGVSIRMTQESVESARDHLSERDPLRVADLSANGTFALVPSLVLHYGMSSRLGMEGQEWAPSTGGEWKVTDGTSLVASGLYKVLDRGPSAAAMPSIVFWSEENRVLPRYAYSFGIVTGKDENNRLSAIASVTAVDSPLRVVFTDGYDQFWDGLHVDSGDLRRDVRVAWRREVGNFFAVDMSTTAGTATSRNASADDRQKVYVTGDLQSTFLPTRTTLAVSYREIQQPREGVVADYRTERINVRMAQSLYLPVDVKLLVGLELARAENSPFLLDTLTPDGTAKKYIGGLSLNF